ncbi:MAG: PIG-L family deacetylase, partial [bacterium]|nr:PIG-L family deacetylase [bacterium]
MSGILLVLAHPDDESFVGGGALAWHARRGIATALLTLTDGQAGRIAATGAPSPSTPETLGRVRREELRRAARRLGIGELITPGLADGGLRLVPDAQGAALVTHHVRRLRPEILITFGPEGAPSHHPDHMAAARWTTQAFDQAADPVFDDGQRPHASCKLYWI